MASVALAQVNLWGHLVGAVAEDEDGVVTFEYAPEFRRLGIEISPLRLPLSLEGPVQFLELRRLEAFAGLPGVLADALPDRFGNSVIRRHFIDRGTPTLQFSPVQKLLYIGRRAMGALEFLPPLEGEAGGNEMPLEVAELVAQARQVVEGRTDLAIPEIIRVGSSAGGMRPKALVLWNEERDTIRSGHAEPREDEGHWILKFDGVQAASHSSRSDPDRADEGPMDYMKIEHCYTLMARAAGIDAVETRLLRERGYAHLMVRRFDRGAEGRVHQHSLGGMQHVDFNVPGAYSYEGYLRTILALGMGQQAVTEAFRRTVFNVAGANQDDHVKNLTFLMGRDGVWRLSPAYDLTFAVGENFTRQHQMSVRGKRAGITRSDLEELAAEFGVPRKGQREIDQVAAALGQWKDLANDVGIPGHKIEAIEMVLRARGIAE